MKERLTSGLVAVAVLGVMGLGSDIPLAAKTPTLIVQGESSQTSEIITIEGRLDENSEIFEDGNYYDVHVFKGKAGETLIIEVRSDEFNPALILVSVDSDYEVIATDSGSKTSNYAKITTTISKTGTYIITVLSKQTREGGSYKLTRRQATQTDNALVRVAQLNQEATQLYQQGNYNEAIPLAQQALAISKEQLGDNHPSTATSLNNLAVLYKSQGRYAEAEPLYQQALAITKEQLGDNHPSTATSLNNLAVLYESQGRYTEAEPIEQNLQQFRADLSDFNKAKGEPWVIVEDIKEESRKLDKQLMQPIRELLGNTKTILLTV